MSVTQPTVPLASGRRSVRRWSLPRAEHVGIGLLLVVTVIALAGPLLAPYNPLRIVGQSLSNPVGGHLLGTDEVGRDTLSRVLCGAQTTWYASLLVVAVGVLIGGIVGTIAGLHGGWVDTILMRIVDAGLALPGMVLAIAITVALGPSLLTTIVGISALWWPFYARLVRGEARVIAVSAHVEAARLAGVGPVRLALRHVVPGLIAPVVIAASLDLSVVVLVLAGLTFIGLGAQPPTPELGAMAASGLSYLFSDPWLPLSPAIAVFILSLSANLGGESLRNLLEDGR